MDIFIPGSDECDYSVQPHLNFQSQTAFCNMLQLFSCTFLCRDMYYIQLSSSLRQKAWDGTKKKSIPVNTQWKEQMKDRRRKGRRKAMSKTLPGETSCWRSLKSEHTHTHDKKRVVIHAVWSIRKTANKNYVSRIFIGDNV